MIQRNCKKRGKTAIQASKKCRNWTEENLTIEEMNLVNANQNIGEKSREIEHFKNKLKISKPCWRTDRCSPGDHENE